MSAVSRMKPLRYRTVFISDVHLGFKGCQAELLLDFLRNVECRKLYLVGDIIDCWNLQNGLYWPQAHNNVIRTILGKAKHDTEVVYVPGNHDELFREHIGLVFGNVTIRRRDLHTTADGRRMLVLHGDEFDGVVKISPLLAKIGARAYGFLLSANHLVNALRRSLGFGYWSLAAFLKHRVKNAVQYIGSFEKAVAHAARKEGVDGLVCGHIHRPEIRDVDGVLYCNDGDWVESCSALVEHFDGRLELLHWAEFRAAAPGPGTGGPAGGWQRGVRIALASDAWMPQTNGVVRTLTNTVRILESRAHRVYPVTPVPFATLPLPTYPDIRVAVRPARRVARILDVVDPDRVHIATEGPVGLAARAWCLRRRRAFTTSFHTRFPEYVRLRAPVPESWSYRLLRWFHRTGRPHPGPHPVPAGRAGPPGFRNPRGVGRGVDTRLFRPDSPAALDVSRPVLMCMGRVAVEKNVEAFLRLNVPGTKIVVGDGPALETLRRAWPDVVFTGARYGESLAAMLAAADVFVFPSRTDTFGVVLLEAMACGVPVAAYPVTGPKDVVVDGVTGVLDEDLAAAVRGALKLDRGACRRFALGRSWEAATDQFLSALVPASAVDPLRQPGGQLRPDAQQHQRE